MSTNNNRLDYVNLYDENNQMVSDIEDAAKIECKCCKNEIHGGLSGIEHHYNTCNEIEEWESKQNIQSPLISGSNEDVFPSKNVLIHRAMFIVIDFLFALCFGIGVILLEVGVFGKPFNRPWRKEDYSIDHEMKNEQVPTFVLILLGLVLPFFVLIWSSAWYFILKQVNRKFLIISVLDFCQNFVTFLFGLSVNLFVTDIIKFLWGGHRPDFIARCEPDYSLLPPNTVWISENICQGREKLITEGRKSFPSGHASMIFYTMVMSCFFLQRISKKYLGDVIYPLIQLGLIALAVFVTISRVQDNRHHPMDLLWGTLIGSAIAIYMNFILTRRYLKFDLEKRRTKKDSE